MSGTGIILGLLLSPFVIAVCRKFMDGEWQTSTECKKCGHIKYGPYRAFPEDACKRCGERAGFNSVLARANLLFGWDVKP